MKNNIFNTRWFWACTGIIWGLTIMLLGYSILKYLIIESIKIAIGD